MFQARQNVLSKYLNSLWKLASRTNVTFFLIFGGFVWGMWPLFGPFQQCVTHYWNPQRENIGPCFEKPQNTRYLIDPDSPFMYKVRDQRETEQTVTETNTSEQWFWAADNMFHLSDTIAKLIYLRVKLVVECSLLRGLGLFRRHLLVLSQFLW